MGPTAIRIDEPQPSPRKPTPAPELGWYLLGWAGWVFLLAGVVDIGMAWIPFHLGNPEWEFGTVTQSLVALVPSWGGADHGGWHRSEPAVVGAGWCDCAGNNGAVGRWVRVLHVLNV
jgi:hypothetical protein